MERRAAIIRSAIRMRQQMVTGADQYEKVEIEDPDYLKAQERTRLLSFYLDSGAGRNPSEACLVAFSTRELQGEEDFLADARTLREGFCMVTELIPLNREKDGNFTVRRLRKIQRCLPEIMRRRTTQCIAGKQRRLRRSNIRWEVTLSLKSLRLRLCHRDFRKSALSVYVILLRKHVFL